MLTTNIEKHSKENCHLRILKLKNFQNLETFKEKNENFLKISKFWGNFSKVETAFERPGYRLCTYKKLNKNLP